MHIDFFHRRGFSNTKIMAEIFAIRPCSKCIHHERGNAVCVFLSYVIQELQSRYVKSRAIYSTNSPGE